MIYKPVILIGNGCRNNAWFVDYLCTSGIPVLTTWQAIDLVQDDCPTFCGRPGMLGHRAANIIQQMATHVHIFGARMDGEQVAYNYARFASNAEISVYDVDQAELDKLPDGWRKMRVDLNESLGVFFPHNPTWLHYARTLYQDYSLYDFGRVSDKYIDYYDLANYLHDITRPNDLIALGSSGAIVNAFLQSYRVKRGQRITVCASIGAMGADIPMALGGAIATGKRTICLTGDGGFQLNTQELETIRRLNLNIKFLVASNGGYRSISNMQKSRFGGRIVGADAASGYTMPELSALADCYDLEYIKVETRNDFTWIKDALDLSGPFIVEIHADPDFMLAPRVGSTMTNGQYTVDDMADMTPKLAPETLARIMEWQN